MIEDTKTRYIKLIVCSYKIIVPFQKEIESDPPKIVNQPHTLNTMFICTSYTVYIHRDTLRVDNRTGRQSTMSS
jgi:hypothetical protein